MKLAQSRSFALSIGLLALFSLHGTTAAQTTAFTYQGRLTDTSLAASGSYDMQFKLFDALTAGSQQGATQTQSSVQVTNGIFTVELDFGSCPTCFNGSDRYLEVAVKPAKSNIYVLLAPRQKITSAPYAIRALNAGSPNWAQVSWATATPHPLGAWSNISPSVMTLTTTAKPLLITMNISLNQGSHGSCRPIVDGIWAGSYGSLPNPGDPFWQEGLILVGSGGWARWSLNRIYPGIPAGNHTFQVQCVTDGGTMQSCGSTIGCSFGVIELH
jgi:hypothetical protein